MASDAGGTNSVVQLSNEGPYMKFIARNTSVDNGEGIPIDGAGGVPGLQAEDKIIILGGTNFSDEKSLWGATFTAAEYDETTMQIIVAGGMSSDDIGIVFIYIPQGDAELGD